MRTPKRYALILALLLLGLSLALLTARAGPAHAGASAIPSAPRPVNIDVAEPCSAPGGYAEERHWA